MLGVFRSDLKKLPSPPEMPGGIGNPAMQEGNLEGFFVANFNHPVIINLGNYGLLAYSADLNIFPRPGPLLCMKGGISCIYRGGAKIMRKGKKVVGYVNEADDLITCYNKLKGKGYQAPFEPFKVPFGDYNYILYDNSRGRESAFAVSYAADLPVYYGYDSLGFCIIADNPLIMMEVCGDTFKTIPKGNGLLIPVKAEIKTEPIEVGSLGIVYPTLNEAEKEIEVNPSDGDGLLIPVMAEIKIEPIEPTLNEAEKEIEVNPYGGNSSSVVDASKGESIKDKSSGGSSPKKTSGGEAAAASAFGGSSSKQGSGEKRSADIPSGGSNSKKGRG